MPSPKSVIIRNFSRQPPLQKSKGGEEADLEKKGGDTAIFKNLCVLCGFSLSDRSASLRHFSQNRMQGVIKQCKGFRMNITG